MTREQQFTDEQLKIVIARGGGRSDVSSLADKPVRLRFVMKDADLYALQLRGQQ